MLLKYLLTVIFILCFCCHHILYCHHLSTQLLYQFFLLSNPSPCSRKKWCNVNQVTAFRCLKPLNSLSLYSACKSDLRFLIWFLLICPIWSVIIQACLYSTQTHSGWLFWFLSLTRFLFHIKLLYRHTFSEMTFSFSFCG